MKVAQLIKILDCISRYEWDVYRYPSQFIRLKQSNWRELKSLQENEEVPVTNFREEEHQKKGMFSWFRKNKAMEETHETEEKLELPQTELELKQYFLDKLYPVQLKWATSTVAEVSFLQQKYYEDEQLKYFLQRFPDTFLLMYFPIISVKKALIDGPIIMISPLEIELIQFVETNANEVIYANDSRFWTSETLEEQKRLINPLINLKRIEKIIQAILESEQIDFPITKTVLSRENHIVFQTEPLQTKFIGIYQYENWFQQKRSFNSPLKSEQLKVVNSILKYCVTTSVRRPEWLEENEELTDEEML